MFKTLLLAFVAGFSTLALADGLPWNSCYVADGGFAYLDAGAACFTCNGQCGTCVPSGAPWATCTPNDGGPSCPAGTPTMSCEGSSSSGGASSGSATASGGSSGTTAASSSATTGSGGSSSGSSPASGSSGAATTGAGGASSGGGVASTSSEAHSSGGCSTGRELGSWLLAGLPLLLLGRRRRR